MTKAEKFVIDMAINWSNQMSRPASETKEMAVNSMALDIAVRRLLKKNAWKP